VSRLNTSPKNKRPAESASNHADSAALPQADVLIRSLDRILRPEGDEPFIMACGGLSRLRAKTG
jgi:hypothetical protein